jgi:predicted nucleic acid-binding protein
MFYRNCDGPGPIRGWSPSWPGVRWISFTSAWLAEIRFGIELVAEPARRAELNDWLTLKVRPMFDGRVLQITEDIMLKWRLLVEEGRKTGHTFSQPDLIIAATAIHHGLTVVTRDRSEFEMARAPVLYPWQSL